MTTDKTAKQTQIGESGRFIAFSRRSRQQSAVLSHMHTRSRHTRGSLTILPFWREFNPYSTIYQLTGADLGVTLSSFFEDDGFEAARHLLLHHPRGFYTVS